MQAIYKLPKLLLAVLLIGGGIAYILISDPPHKFCDSQLEHFRKVQKETPLGKERKLCKEENRPGSCYEYFARLRRFVRNFRILSEECLPLVYAQPEIRKALAGGLALMTALAYREGVLSAGLSKYNWLTEPDLHLFCQLKTKYTLFYGQAEYKQLEIRILNLLPVQRRVPADFLIRKTILTEPCSR